MSECTARRQPEATANYKCLFFLDIGHDALRPSENSNESHMVSYCSAIKCLLKALIFGTCKKEHNNVFLDEASVLSST